MIDLRSLTIDELEKVVIDLGEKKFRTKQIYSWIQEKAVLTIDDMTNIPKSFKNELKKIAYINNMKVLKALESKSDGTKKYLMQLRDGNIIESVLMRYKHGNTVCVSTQIGCRMGCTFCASTIDGVERNLSPGEILGQIITIQNDIGDRISNVVLMGSGEPLDNYDNVTKFLRLVNDDKGLNIGMRNITLSTCGLTNMMMELGREFPQITLAISLHAPTDDMRSKMMPINNKYNIENILEACREYIAMTNRRVSFEYSLIDGVNDGRGDALLLAKLLKGMLCHVNLIPLNTVKERNYRGTKRDKAKEFQQVLLKNGVEATIRREMGSDIDAACGQLRRGYMKEQKTEQ